MKQFAKLSTILLAVLLLFACKSRVDLENGTFTGRHIRLGSEVMLINKKMEVVLVKDGRIFASGFDGKYKEVYKMKRIPTWLLLRTVKRTGMKGDSFDEPGKQLSYFLQYNSNRKDFQWKWGKDGAVPPEQLKKPVDDLREYLKK